MFPLPFAVLVHGGGVIYNKTLNICVKSMALINFVLFLLLLEWIANLFHPVSHVPFPCMVGNCKQVKFSWSWMDVVEAWLNFGLAN